MVSTARMRDYEAATEVIITRLNMPAPPSPIRRVAALLDFLHEVRKRKRLERMERMKEFVNLPVLRQMINAKIIPYANKWTPVFLPANDLEPVIVWSKKVAERLNAEDEPRTPWEFIHDEQWRDPKEFEQMAIWFVLHKGHWERYRHCEVETCKKWFYAITDQQKHCSKACRQKKAAKSDTFKQKRRAYMQKTRLEEKVEDLKAEIRVADDPATRKRLKEKLTHVSQKLDDAETALAVLRGTR